mmetsp:Transcript_3845/g.24368  ORF Transcript_3845/g.24368 Transcript_3845/m.24368 type:complete len:95 (-) Transcript_3845:2646-2930(-)
MHVLASLASLLDNSTGALRVLWNQPCSKTSVTLSQRCKRTAGVQFHHMRWMLMGWSRRRGVVCETIVIGWQQTGSDGVHPTLVRPVMDKEGSST